MAIHATPSMLIMIAAGGIFATGIGLIIGTLAGYSGGTIDTVLTSFSDFAMTIPGLPLIMVLGVVFRPDNPVLIGLLITVNYWAGLGRAIRSQVLTLREESYVEASRTMGVSTPRILFKDIIPNLMPFVLVNFANAARYIVFTSVGLYYLSILPPSVPNWGYQLNNAYKPGQRTRRDERIVPANRPDDDDYGYRALAHPARTRIGPLVQPARQNTTGG